MDLYKIALLIVRLFGAVWLVVGLVMIIGTTAGAFLFIHLEGVWYFLLQYFIYGLLEFLSGVALLALGRPIARFVSRKL
jgi:hypothetical protein